MNKFKYSSFQIKCTKTFEDSAIGSSFGPTFTSATENGESPLKIFRVNSLAPKFNSITNNPSKCSKSSDQESSNPSCNDENIPNTEENHNQIFTLGTKHLKSEDSITKKHRSNSDLEVHSSNRRFTVPELRIQDLNTTPIDEEKFEPNSSSVTPIDIDNIQFIDCVQNLQQNPTSNNNSDCENVDNNSKENLDIQKNMETRSETKSLDRCSLRVPKKFLHSLEYSSEHLLSPHNQKYDEISVDYGSSRSESPSERRSGRKVSIFRRESRFRSIRGRGFESGKMTAKDKKLLKMILVIFSSFLICYLPITITKTFKDLIDWRGLNIAGYILIYLTTCINPVIYVIMSSEYRSAYKNALLCRSDSSAHMAKIATAQDKKKKTDSGSK